jgi:hypothetical protein
MRRFDMADYGDKLNHYRFACTLSCRGWVSMMHHSPYQWMCQHLGHSSAVEETYLDPFAAFDSCTAWNGATHPPWPHVWLTSSSFSPYPTPSTSVSSPTAKRKAA